MDDAIWSSTGPLFLSLAIGLLIGVERGWRSRAEPDGARVAGLRTFGLLGLTGGIAGLVQQSVGALLAGLIVAGGIAALLAGYLRDLQAHGSVSVTSCIAAILTLAFGLLATSGFPVPAAACAATMTLLLASRRQLHGWLAGLSEADVQATARFAIITAVVLPLLPDRSFGPYGAWNPRDLWLVVVLVTGFSFAGYAANKRFGARNGTLATAAIGGLYSSTAVTAVLSRRLRDKGEPARPLAAGIALASALMFVRVLVLTAVLAPEALATLAMIIVPAALLTLLASLWLVRRSRGADGRRAAPDMASGNPFELLPALGFAALVAVTALATRWAEARFGAAGTATLIAITGSFDVDAAVVTLGGLPDGTLRPSLAGVTLAVPVLVNNLFKSGIVIVTAGPGRGWKASLPLLASCAAIVAGLAGQLLLQR